MTVKKTRTGFCSVMACLVFLFSTVSATAEEKNDSAENDARFQRLLNNTKSFQTIVEIDHARLAAKAGVPTMPPSRVLIFNNPQSTTPLLQAEPMLGLELPYRVLAFEEMNKESGKNTGVPAIAFTNPGFLRARYNLDDSVDLSTYEEDIKQSVSGLDPALLQPVSGESVTSGYGIKTIKSQFDFATTLKNVREAIMAEGDTVWFGTVDYQADAKKIGMTLPAATLLLFGGPGPGGKAMSEYPKLGLDAFCQKILVLESADGSGIVSLHFNDIVALAKLHYGSSNKPQAVINKRLMATLSGAVQKPGNSK